MLRPVQNFDIIHSRYSDSTRQYQTPLSFYSRPSQHSKFNLIQNLRCLKFLSSSSTSQDLKTVLSNSKEQADNEVQLVNGRLSGEGKSLDIRLINNEIDVVLSHLNARKASEDQLQVVQKLQELSSFRTEQVKIQQAALTIRKSISQEIGKLMRNKEENAEKIDALKQEVEEANKKASNADEELVTIEEKLDSLIKSLPNLLDDIVPDGEDETANPVVHEWGTDLRRIGEEGSFPWHDEVAMAIGGYDPDSASRLSGARFSVLRGSLAQLERALKSFFIDFLTTECEYTEFSVPYIVSRSTLEGTGQLPKFEDDLFKVNHQVSGEDAFLIPTAEVPLTNMLKNELIDEEKLPMFLCGLTPCFRAEAGSAGRDTRGLLRQHQFHKVEMVKITTPESSNEEHEKMTRNAEMLLEALKLPYRKVRLCSGDIGFSARHCYDLEVWLPGQQMYREVSSISTCGDFQAKRMNLRYRSISGVDKKGKPIKKNIFPHTMNGSGLAVGRALVAILETYVNVEDMSVTIPDVLVPYMGGKTKIEAVVS